MLRAALAALVVLVYVAHASLYAPWVVDDAGISLAYARNLAEGHGLVAQPGAAPVEGYSNPLWVASLAAVHLVGGTELPFVPKALGGLCALLGLGLFASLLPGAVAAGFAGLLCALNPSFVIWTTSGLENGLYVLGAGALAVFTLRATGAGGGDRDALGAGLAAAAMALTRPEGIAWGAFFGVMWWGRGGHRGRAVRVFAGAVAIPVLLHMAGRVVVFGDVVPNTYHVKGGPDLVGMIGTLLVMAGPVEKLLRLTVTTLGMELSNGVLLLAGFLAWRVASRRPLGPELGGLATGLVLATGLYQLLPADWMGELRFATLVFPFHAFLLAGLLDAYFRLPPPGQEAPPLPAGVMVGAVGGALLLAAFPDFHFRALRYADEPNISVDFVTRAYAARFDRFAEALGLDPARHSVMLPDVGGALLHSKLRVHDLAGLCDRALAKALRDDPARAREYILGEVRPTFLHLVHIWAKRLDLGSDPRFERDFVALHEYSLEEDPRPAGIPSGWYVRREAVAGKEAVLAELRREDLSLGGLLEEIPEGPVHRVLRALRDPHLEEDG